MNFPPESIIIGDTNGKTIEQLLKENGFAMVSSRLELKDLSKRLDSRKYITGGDYRKEGNYGEIFCIADRKIYPETGTPDFMEKLGDILVRNMGE